MDDLLKQEVKDFLTTRRARLQPSQAGIAHQMGDDRRVPGLRREEVAKLAGISLEYYIRFERGNLKGVSRDILESLSKALQLSDIEKQHLINLAQRAENSRQQLSIGAPTAPLQDIVDALSGNPAWIRNEQMDILATNSMCATLYEPIFKDLPDRPNTARHCYMGASAGDFWVDREALSAEFAAKLRLEYARRPSAPGLKELIDELHHNSSVFRENWATADVTSFGAGIKRFNHPEIGLVTYRYETFNINSAPGYVLSVYFRQ
ncbi:transcriptional regulator [Corynebacterium deserti GIMN1.010]|uniref:Transcriptional regulator n=1 Tax=Corynebacterium deserti GIMN1.010 TaxID=931089 RepID=A0A0M3Q943_9CORY|nr:helix-turn-helix transcriptional regulator [Corynebacterium deserti]ALC04983.1 transcriptional regulator [Corynebacterium deserti GIMN1.010]